jgi:hypothetical protein
MSEIRIAFDELANCDLIVGAIYESDPTRHSYGAEPLSNMFPSTGNNGGFRYRRGDNGEVVSLLLTSSGIESEWPDTYDEKNGVFTYFGDNRKPGVGLLETSRKGNQVLKTIFDQAHGGRADRAKCPLTLVFQSTREARNMKFVGLAVPGAAFAGTGEDLVAFWSSKDGSAFQNYRALFTILNAKEISGDWVREVIGNADLDLGDTRIPPALLRWIMFGQYEALELV